MNHKNTTDGGEDYFDFNVTEWSDYSELVDLKHLKQVMQPVMVAVGTAGNILTYAVLRRSSFRQQSVCFYLRVYVIMCTFILALDLGCEWLFNILELVAIKNMSEWSCRIWQFVYNVVLYSVNWLIVAVSIDRYIVTWHPSKSKRICTVFIGKVAVLAICIGLVVVSVHALWTYELVAFEELGITKTDCSVGESDLHTRIWAWLSTSMYKFIPLAVLFIFNIMILLGLCIKREHACRPFMRAHNLHSMTSSCVAMTLTFFVTVAPVTVIEPIGYQLAEVFASDLDLYKHYSFIHAICAQITNINLVIPFFYCFIISSSFRKKTIKMSRKLIRRKRTKDNLTYLTNSRNSGRSIEVVHNNSDVTSL